MDIPDFMPTLSHGGHANPKQGACVMEMVSYIAGEKWSDRPDCVHDSIQEIARQVNDFVSDDNRNIIATMIPRFIGTQDIKDTELRDKVSKNLKAHPELGQFADKKYKVSGYDVLSTLKYEFSNQQDMSKRFTNEEYDKFAMTILEVVLDAADEIMERGNYEVTLDEAFAKVSELPNQRVKNNV